MDTPEHNIKNLTQKETRYNTTNEHKNVFNFFISSVVDWFINIITNIKRK